MKFKNFASAPVACSGATSFLTGCSGAIARSPNRFRHQIVTRELHLNEFEPTEGPDATSDGDPFYAIPIDPILERFFEPHVSQQFISLTN